MATIGIDLGTSNSAAAIAIGDEARMIEPAEGATDDGMVFPSYVAFDATGRISCAGVQAKRQYQSAADLVVRHFKRLIGRSYDYISRTVEEAELHQRGGRFLDEFKERVRRGDTGEVKIRVGKNEVQEYTPQELARLVLEKLREDAEQQVFDLVGSYIDRAVITVPAGFDDAALRATLWAGEQVFGPGNITLIPEPLAAAIASGVTGSQETIMVVDMGAGTTDIVVGNVIRQTGSFEWVPVTQACDDELGGLDMDCLILDHLLNVDRKEPLLRDIYPDLDHRNRGRLMEAIERAKIAVSTAETGQVSTVLEAQVNGTQVRKPVVFTLDAQNLRSIVAYKGKKTFEDKGSVVERCRQLVEQVLLELANGDLERVNEVKQSLDRVILVGGPMRMRALYDMMQEVFADRLDVLEGFDPLNPFPMECVAKGAALYQGGKITHQVPHTLSVFSWGKGGSYQTLIPRGTPYDDEATASAEIDVDEGATWIDIVTEKENVSLPNYPVREHVVRVPEKGRLTVTLRWDTTGCRVVLNGAGLSYLEIPPVSDQTTLQEDFERQVHSFLQTVHRLREYLSDTSLRDRVQSMLLKNAIKHAPPALQMMFTMDPETALDNWKIQGKPLRDYLDGQIDKIMKLPNDELVKCDNIDPIYLAKLKEDEIKVLLEKGYNLGLKDRLRARSISEQVYEATSLIRSVSGEKVSVQELVALANQLLTKAEMENLGIGMIEELKSMVSQLEHRPGNRSLIANVSVRAAALADVMHDQGYIQRDMLRRAKWIAARAEE